MADAKNVKATNAWEYSRVVLTLENCLLPEEKICPTPSMQDGLDPEIELDLRILGCEFIQTAGILLKLPQVSLESRLRIRLRVRFTSLFSSESQSDLSFLFLLIIS